MKLQQWQWVETVVAWGPLELDAVCQCMNFIPRTIKTIYCAKKNKNIALSLDPGGPLLRSDSARISPDYILISLRQYCISLASV